MTDTTNTNTNTAHAAALAMRNAAAALARRRPLYDGASGESADEDLAQAIEDLPLPVDTTDWRTEAEWLRAEVARLSPTEDEIRYTADQDWTGLSGATAWHLAERHGEGWAGIGAMMEAWRDAEVQRITAGLAADLARAQEQAQAERDKLVRREEVAGVVGELHKKIDFTEWHLVIISKMLGSPVPLEIDDIAVRLNMLIIERNQARAGLAAKQEEFGALASEYNRLAYERNQIAADYNALFLAGRRA